MKKIIKLSLKTIGIFLLLLVILLGFLIYRGAGITIGRCLLAKNESYILVDDNSPIEMSTNRSNMFKNLSTGDKILVIHSGVNESYPGSTGAYFCIKLGNGDISDIPSQVIHNLTEMGWIERSNSSQKSNESISQKTEPLYFQHGSVQIKMRIPDHWDYEFVAIADPEVGQGIYIWPKDAEYYKIGILNYPRFGVCGTGLYQEDIKISAYDARVGTYDDSEQWSFIHFKEPYEDYVILNYSEDPWSSWTDEFQMELQKFLILLNFQNPSSNRIKIIKSGGYI